MAPQWHRGQQPMLPAIAALPRKESYGDTVIVVDVAMEFNDAPIWLVPGPVAVASPLLPDTLLCDRIAPNPGP